MSIAPWLQPALLSRCTNSSRRTVQDEFCPSRIMILLVRPMPRLSCVSALVQCECILCTHVQPHVEQAWAYQTRWHIEAGAGLSCSAATATSAQTRLLFSVLFQLPSPSPIHLVCPLDLQYSPSLSLSLPFSLGTLWVSISQLAPWIP